jgi:uncharacterized protein (DUF488 family)
MPLELFTIGHSTHSAEEFVALIQQHEIGLLADIRRFPGSRKYPHFNRENLESILLQAGIEYRWLEALGGRRNKAKNIAVDNSGLRNASFKNYADYMQTPEFRAALEELLALAKHKRTAYMCSESVFWRCHRRLVSDYLLGLGHAVWHIMPTGALRPHTLTDGAHVSRGSVTYPAGDVRQSRLAFD